MHRFFNNSTLIKSCLPAACYTNVEIYRVCEIQDYAHKHLLGFLFAFTGFTHKPVINHDGHQGCVSLQLQFIIFPMLYRKCSPCLAFKFRWKAKPCNCTTLLMFSGNWLNISLWYVQNLMYVLSAFFLYEVCLPMLSTFFNSGLQGTVLCMFKQFPVLTLLISVDMWLKGLCWTGITWIKCVKAGANSKTCRAACLENQGWETLI